MKKTVLISVACTLAAVLLIGLVVWLVVGNKPEGAVETFSTYEGEIVEIGPCDEGYLLSISVANDSSADYDTIRVLANEDTELSGSFADLSLQELLEEQIAGIFVSAEVSDNPVVIDGRNWYPAKSITITGE